MTEICPVIVGPTAVGKTSLILSLAAKEQIEIISLDSRQIYCGMKIGTAQPSKEELSACKHHLINFLSPTEKYSAQTFRKDFCKVYNEIKSRGSKPVLVGGAGMYLTALKKGLLNLSDPNSQTVRDKLNNLTDLEIRNKLLKADPDSFDRIHPNDRYRSQRALEIFELTNISMTQHIKAQENDPALGLNFQTLFLNRERSELHDRIAYRTHLMLETGWVQETEDLLRKYKNTDPGLKSIGYREICACLNGELTQQDLPKRIIEVTRQYAKRQITWFKAIPTFTSCHPEDSNSVAKFTDYVWKKYD